MNLEEMKKKLESGDYVLIGYFLVRGFNYWAQTDMLIKDNCLVKEYKLIHKKHKDILDAYLEDNNVEIEFKLKDGIFTHLRADFIDGYSEEDEYQLKQPKPKNNFKEFGFEADFDGEILGERHGFYLGWFRTPSGDIFHGMWDKNGYNKCSSVGNAIYDTIKPLKKEWYENKDNIGKLCTTTDTEELFFFSGILSDNCAYATRDFQKGNREGTKWVNVSLCRPLSKEEVLSLLIEE